MSNIVKVGFVGNCQAQALEAWVSQIAAGIEVIRFDPIWLIRDTDFAQFQAQLSRCDVVFAQRVADDYSIQWLRTKDLKESFEGRLFTWPSVYFDGYFPGLQYLYHGLLGKQLGPLDEYHYSFVIDSYLKQRSVEDCVDLLTTDRIFDHFPNPVHNSLEQLFVREVGLDVSISDFLIQSLGASRSMFSMNHPCDFVLREMMKRLLARAGLLNRISAVGSYQYTLDKIIVPLHPAISNRYLLFDDLQQARFKGVRFAFTESCVTVGSTIDYSPKELVEAYYRCYDHIKLGAESQKVD